MPRGAEKVHRPAELRRAATKARPEAELPRRSVARLARSHPLAGPLLARQAVDLPAAHWAPAVHPGVTLPAAARLKAVPADRRAAARPRAVPAADRAVVPPAADAAARRVRSQKVISAVALRLSLTWLAPISLHEQGGPGLPCCSFAALKHRNISHGAYESSSWRA
jgi:hypothetical protein